MNVCETIKQLNSEKTDAFMHELYGKGAAENKARYEKVLKGFEQAFGDSKEVLLFSSPGRTEISGSTVPAFLALGSRSFKSIVMS